MMHKTRSQCKGKSRSKTNPSRICFFCPQSAMRIHLVDSATFPCAYEYREMSGLEGNICANGFGRSASLYQQRDILTIHLTFCRKISFSTQMRHAFANPRGGRGCLDPMLFLPDMLLDKCPSKGQWWARIRS